MHYLNGREARDGDHVVYRDSHDTQGRTITGVLYDTQLGAHTCNARLSIFIPGGQTTRCVTIAECLLAGDAFDAVTVLLQPPSDPPVTPTGLIGG